jgi:virulence factor Mce-like protein
VRRVLVALGVAALIIGSVVLAGAGQDSGYRVDAIFDNSDFLVPGQDVKIAGTKVGTIDDVTLTPDRHAQVEMLVTNTAFTPFKGDADCSVQLQSLIGERFVECYPGSSAGSDLKQGDDGADVVPLANTHSPVDLDLVLNTFRAPEPQRLALLLSSLGAGVAGRGDDLNQVIRRAAPALQQSARVMDVLNQNGTALRSLLADGNAVLAQLDRRRASLARFIHASGDLSGTLADRRAALAKAVGDLPVLLEQLNPYLDEVDNVATQTLAPLRSLDSAAVPLDGLLTQLDRTSTQVRPALGPLTDTVNTLRAAVPDLRPTLGRLAAFARAARPAGALSRTLLQSLYDQRFVEGLQSFFYYATAAVARFDQNSHLVAAYPIIGACINYAKTPTAGCSSNFPGAPVAARRAPVKRKTVHPARPTRPAHRPAAPAPAATPTPAVDVPELPILGQPVQQVVQQLQGLLGGGQQQPQNLLDFLLKP